MSPGEVRRVERWLASARVFLAVSALVALWMDSGTIHYSIWAFGLLAFYIAQGMIIIIFLRRRQQSTPSFRVLVHSADIIWPALISILAVGQGNTFFLFFVFVLAAAAYRWGLWETLGTALAAVLLLWTESLALHWGFFPAVYGFLVRVHWPHFLGWLYAFLFRHNWPPLHIDVTYFEPKALFMRSVYLVVIGLLLGYLAEQQKQLRAEKAIIARTLGRARVDSGVTGTLQDVCRELLSIYRARHVFMASQEVDSHRVFVAELSAEGQGAPFQWLESSPTDPETYLHKTPVAACYVEKSRRNGSQGFSLLALDDLGNRIADPTSEFLTSFARIHPFSSAMVASFAFGQEWLGRVFLLDPTLTGEREEELHFLQEWVRQVGPAVYNVLLLRRLRLRAGAVERARFARELHDGAVQSLIAVEMQVDVLRRQAATKPEILPAELGRIQGLLREEVLKLRELMQQMKTLDVDAKRLHSVIHDTVERFQRETGIAAQFVSDVTELQMPQPVCREVARIVQEALVNVRKHSQARQVLVRFGATNGNWKMEIQDDGRGFPFSGRLSQHDLDSMGKGPAVIKERVRLIEGELTIESHPGQGSRLEITVPQQKAAAHG